MRAEKTGSSFSANIYLAATHRLATMSTVPNKLGTILTNILMKFRRDHHLEVLQFLMPSLYHFGYRKNRHNPCLFAPAYQKLVLARYILLQ